MSSSPVRAWVIAAIIPILGLVAAGWLLFPTRTLANCLQPALALPGTLVAVTIASLVLSATAFVVSRLSRAAGITLLIVLLVFALGVYLVGGWVISDSYFPEYVASRAACGRSAADVATWGWPIAMPLLVIASSAAWALLRRPWGELVASTVALALCATLILTFV